MQGNQPILTYEISNPSISLGIKRISLIQRLGQDKFQKEHEEKNC